MAHTDKHDTLDGAEQGLKKHEDFVCTMDANMEKLASTLEGGQRLVDSGNLYSPRVQDKMDSIHDRSVFFWYNICLITLIMKMGSKITLQMKSVFF